MYKGNFTDRKREVIPCVTIPCLLYSVPKPSWISVIEQIEDRGLGGPIKILVIGSYEFHLNQRKWRCEFYVLNANAFVQPLLNQLIHKSITYQ